MKILFVIATASILGTFSPLSGICHEQAFVLRFRNLNSFIAPLLQFSNANMAELEHESRVCNKWEFQRFASPVETEQRRATLGRTFLIDDQQVVTKRKTIVMHVHHRMAYDFFLTVN